MAEAIAKTWVEPEFTQRLLQSPVEAFTELGISLDSNVEVRVHRGSEAKFALFQSGNRTVYNLTLAPCPTELHQQNIDEDLTRLQRAPTATDRGQHIFCACGCACGCGCNLC